EYVHRTLSVVVGVILVVAMIVVSRMKPRPSGAYRSLLLSFVLLLIQIGLGNVVVNSDLNAAVTALHLANATALFGVMVVSGVLMYLHEKANRY
ncbi:MAG: COX15/CtaA family protein, partial [Thaumarchaeota archaeon]|nr:COX15/CtaA family protein [Nitrososphaerota archaeon]